MADEMKRESAELRKTVDDVWDEYVQARGHVERPQLTTARKSHRCQVCGNTIVKGTPYVRLTVYPSLARTYGEMDVPWTYKAHDACDKLWTMYGDAWEQEFPHPKDWHMTVEERGIVNPHPPDVQPAREVC